MKTSIDSNAAIWKAYTKSKIDLWDQNMEYVISFEFNPELDQSVKNLLPEVCHIRLEAINEIRLRRSYSVYHLVFIIWIWVKP